VLISTRNHTGEERTLKQGANVGTGFVGYCRDPY